MAHQPPLSDSDQLSLALSMSRLRDFYETLHCGTMHLSRTPPTRCSKCGAALGLQDATRHSAPIAPPCPRSIIVHPTVGDFGNYDPRCLLHCGVSNSDGSRVYNFDQRSTAIDSALARMWAFSISSPIEHASLSDAEWDEALASHHEHESARARQRGMAYHSLDNNCYSYVIRFLEWIRFEQRDTHAKDDIVTRFIAHPVEVRHTGHGRHDMTRHDTTRSPHSLAHRGSSSRRTTRSTSGSTTRTTTLPSTSCLRRHGAHQRPSSRCATRASEIAPRHRNVRGSAASNARTTVRR